MKGGTVCALSLTDLYVLMRIDRVIFIMSGVEYANFTGRSGFVLRQVCLNHTTQPPDQWLAESRPPKVKEATTWRRDCHIFMWNDYYRRSQSVRFRWSNFDSDITIAFRSRFVCSLLFRNTSRRILNIMLISLDISYQEHYNMQFYIFTLLCNYIKQTGSAAHPVAYPVGTGGLVAGA
jgi:hypothetical protein